MPSDTQSASTHAFQAEVSRLLHLMVHSVYTEKEIFLRELISNASDACDKLRYEAISRPELIEADARLAIRIEIDAGARKLTIVDNGIGMTEAEMVENLGTIARSGTRAFIERVAAEKDSSNALIGQFGVGFYSAFMVADHIEVISRRAGEPTAAVWMSDGANGFSIAPASETQSAAVPRGTRVSLSIKTGDDKFLEKATIEQIVRTYSDHIQFPVELVDEDGKARQVNAASALWQRSKSDVKSEEYDEAYKTIAGQFDDPALTMHWRAEGRQSYAVLLFVPTRRPFDLYDVGRKGRVKLYVRRVYITDDADLLPSWLRFVRGVVDSEDVPLNVSREMLQNNPAVGQIRKAVTSRVVSELEQLGDKDASKFETVWDTFGPVIKEGIYEDFERRDQLLKLARFRSTAGSGWRSLKDYVAALRPNQTDIYYLAGENLDRLKASPQLEAAAARGIEVLLMADPVDSFWTTLSVGYEGKPLRSLTQGEVDLSLIPLLEESNVEAPPSVEVGVLIAKLKAALGDHVGDVRISKRLVSSPVCLVASGSGPDLALDRLLQKRNEGAGMKPVLEINPTHPIVKTAALGASANRDEEVADIGFLLLDQARILDGEPPTRSSQVHGTAESVPGAGPRPIGAGVSAWLRC
jgi:molecular chaperone HtpG